MFNEIKEPIWLKQKAKWLLGADSDGIIQSFQAKVRVLPLFKQQWEAFELPQTQE
jgi:hypothetical protein